MTISSLFWVACGGAVGAVLRWLLALSLNQMSTHLAIGTLAANAVGALLMGIFISALQKSVPIPAALQLFIMTGLLGALTTFSTFTAESFTLLQQGSYFYFFTHLLLHLAGSLLCFSLGFVVFKFLSS